MFKKNTPTMIAQSSASFIGEGCEVTGDITCHGKLRIEGKLIGNIQGDGDIEVATTGVIEGQFCEAQNLTIQGSIKSNIRAKGSVHLLKQAHVEGDIESVSLDIESGARFVGHSNTGQAMERLTTKPQMVDQAVAGS